MLCGGEVPFAPYGSLGGDPATFADTHITTPGWGTEDGYPDDFECEWIMPVRCVVL